MNNENSELQTNPQKMQKDIDELHSKYDNLSKEVKQLDGNKATISHDLKQIHEEFEQINTNIDQIILKLNQLSDEYSKGIKIDKENTLPNSMKKVFTNPLRKIAVGTLSAVYAVADKTMEGTSNFRESIEDIVAEAQYSNKKNKMPPMETNEISKEISK